MTLHLHACAEPGATALASDFQIEVQEEMGVALAEQIAAIIAAECGAEESA